MKPSANDIATEIAKDLLEMLAFEPVTERNAPGVVKLIAAHLERFYAGDAKAARDRRGWAVERALNLLHHHQGVSNSTVLLEYADQIRRYLEDATVPARANKPADAASRPDRE